MTPPTEHSTKRNVPKFEGENSLAHQYPEVAAEWAADLNGEMTPWMVRPGSNRKLWWTCAGGHTWQAAPYTRTRGHGCGECKGTKATPEKNLAVDRPDITLSWDVTRNAAEFNLSAADLLSKSNKRVWWICPVDSSHGYLAAPAERAKGQGCPFCAGKQFNASNSLAAVRPLVAREWDPANDKTPHEIGPRSDYRAKWICSADPSHKWEAIVSSRPATGKGCPYCAGKRPTERNRLDMLRPDLARQWHPTKNGALTPDMVTIKSGKRIWWICENDPDHTWQVPPSGRAVGDGCPWCAPMVRSQTEIRICAELESIFPGEVDPGPNQKRFDLGHNRPYTVDVLMEARAIIVEFDGSYYHSGAAHEERDRRKSAGLRALGYRVVRVREEPLEVLDAAWDLTVPRRLGVKGLVDAVLKHLVGLGCVGESEVAAYLAGRGLAAAARAEEIIAGLSPAERFVPPSHKARA